MFKIIREIHNSLFPKLVLILIVFLSIEFSFKARRFILYCYGNQACDFFVDVLKIKEGATLGLSTQDEKLGYVSKPYLNIKINNYGWDNINLKTIEYGIRYDEKNNNPRDVLVVGESSAFGAQVKNDQTWQSCLNRKQSKFNFINAAVFGYGPGLSYLRAKNLSDNFKTEFIILSTLIGAGAERDKLSFAGGKPTASIIKTKNGLTFANPPNPDIVGSIFSDKKPNIISYIFAFSDLISEYQPIHRRLVSKNLKVVHPNSASEEEILPWIIKKTKNFKVPFLWVIQYQSKLTEKMKNEREFLIQELKKNNVEFVDSYDYVHGKKSVFTKNELWDMHHTYQGNEQVCIAIFNHLNNKLIK